VLILLIVGASFAPSNWHMMMRNHLGFHYAAHVAAFACVSAVATPRGLRPRTLFAVWAIFSLLGFSLELIQHILLIRNLTSKPGMEWRDVLADFLGAMLGVVLAKYYSNFRVSQDCPER
jgi:hypothetical protein